MLLSRHYLSSDWKYGKIEHYAKNVADTRLPAAKSRGAAATLKGNLEK
jgi:hypothetical protein